LKEKLELCVERLGDVNPQLRQNALDLINSEISIATSSMTSVPKPLKFLTPLYPKLKETYAANKLED
jgi:26S proteasome regulatory subunit N1